MMRRWLLPLLLTALPLAAPAPALGQQAAPFLWQVQGAHAAHWLLGSVHLLPAHAAELPAAVQGAYAQSDALLFESDLEALSAPGTQQRLVTAARAERPLPQVLDEADYQRLTRRLQALDLPGDMLDAFRPWFVGMTLQVMELQAEGFDAAHGVDLALHTRARADGRHVDWLEAPNAHIALLTDMPRQTSLEFLLSTLDEAGAEALSPKELLRIWREADLDTLAGELAALKREYPAMYDHLLASRNRAWVPALREKLNQRRTWLFVVGAAHLAGPDGLLQLLREAGYEIRAAADACTAADRQQPGCVAP